jgi:FAD-dependent urate hydroxylase
MIPVAIIGAGPYGLSTAAHLRNAGMDVAMFGETMGAWARMPPGMLLRSFREATNIGDPGGRLTLDAFAAERGQPIPTPVPVTDFVEYGRWFQAKAVPVVDKRFVANVEENDGGFRLMLDDGAQLEARSVVVAAGIGPFAHMPPELEGLDASRVSHSSAHLDLGRFSGRRLLVVGAGQSALEWAVLAAEAGGSVEILAPHRPRFLRGERLHDRSGVLRALVYPTLGVGPPGLNWVMGYPFAFRRLPRPLAKRLSYRAIRPAGAAWLRSRLQSVVVTSGVRITGVDENENGVAVMLNDGTERRADHLMAATGYRVDIGKYPFLPVELTNAIRRIDGFPVLTRSYESSVKGLYFVGAPAARSMGPGMRFVSHSRAAGAAAARGIGAARG